MTILYIPNPTQYLNLTSTLLTIIKQQIRSLLRQKMYLWFVISENWTLKLFGWSYDWSLLHNVCEYKWF